MAVSFLVELLPFADYVTADPLGVDAKEVGHEERGHEIGDLFEVEALSVTRPVIVSDPLDRLAVTGSLHASIVIEDYSLRQEVIIICY
jgi:hypothetical protein